ncbi:unnamed protein product [Medioppia subpectinata]|uniref:Uncharacterized protein n=1 Tax=Medioppia subpectinata TaxID=1979941 RepID=A0A7R9KTC7_9ACAR|nr:unnamed protein product [Medioppia subpectinata]CAG2109095.1 unnamed protein product [Medioppia subpectinata]
MAGMDSTGDCVVNCTLGYSQPATTVYIAPVIDLSPDLNDQHVYTNGKPVTTTRHPRRKPLPKYKRRVLRHCWLRQRVDLMMMLVIVAQVAMVIIVPFIVVHGYKEMQYINMYWRLCPVLALTAITCMSPALTDVSSEVWMTVSLMFTMSLMISVPTLWM